jgi:polyisoprenyl-phosphate glycosyltransferase
VERVAQNDSRPREGASAGVPLLSAVVACYRDAEAVPLMYARLTETFARIGAEYEIIFVNDGSPDNAAEVLGQLAGRDSRVVVITHTRAFGSQSAFTSGMRVATGDAVILLDGDLQDPPELIVDFYEQWQKGYEIVYGQRVNREAPRLMRWAYKGFYRVFSRLAYISVPLDAGDFSLMDRRVVDELNRLPESSRFIRGLRAWVGFRSIGVPYVRPERAFGRTTNSFVKNLLWARRGIVSFSYAPLELILLIALGSVVIAVVAGVVQVALRIANPSSVPSGITTVILLILVMGGLILLSLSIIGFYVADIYTEVKMRPPFIVDSVLNPPKPRADSTGDVENAADA